ncbi:alpha/beta-type small acid-soluble spore protein [Clostridium sp. MSJ-11]|uniref:Alpha/beta-type small acid-soluble spore protein n=1 Tax=Clostridium mobile TaxID=2841512 RepID=A0ABS6EKJ0_9CLOT|nr:alpha/beta-type small acid-soluble spore protein [Clostridium mobile]MBU5485563.1 alpha/beta-type small acid-soluble spore protein [Clostridium mobile]
MARKRLYSSDSRSNMEKLKMEIASDLGINPNFEDKTSAPYMGDHPSNFVGNLTSAGMLGGEMVKRMVEDQERKMIDK